MADLNLQAIHDEMVSVAYDAGAMMLAANPADIDTGTKLNCEQAFPAGRKQKVSL
jgi:myo-inositol-1(or 4)-monophosphatase